MRCSLLVATLVVPSMGFLVPVTVRLQTSSLAMADKVEVCGFKDCKRAGGGSRLEKQITEILEERGVKMEVLNCDCQVSSIKDMTVGGIDYDDITHTCSN